MTTRDERLDHANMQADRVASQMYAALDAMSDLNVAERAAVLLAVKRGTRGAVADYKIKYRDALLTCLEENNIPAEGGAE